MTRKPAKAETAGDRPPWILETVLLALCLCILALRVTYTEAPTAQMSSTLPANLADTLYSLTVSSLLIFAFVFWLIVRIYRGGPAYRVTGMEFGLALFVAAAVIAAAGASDKRAAVNQALTLLGPLLAALLLTQILTTDVRIRLVLIVVVALGAVSAYQCAEQLLVSNRITIEQYEQNPKMFLDPLGIDPGTFQQFLFEHRLYSRGIRGYFTTSNSAASFSIVALFAALVLLIRKRSRGEGHAGLHPMLLPAFATLVVVAGLLITRSKGGILAFIAGLASFAALLALRRRLGTHRRLVLKVLVPLVLLLAGLGGGVMVRYGLKHGSLPGGNSMFVRWQYWTASARMYADHPWTGVGLGNFSDYYPHYKPAAALESVSDPHNILLSVVTQCGPLGLLGFLAIVFVPLWRIASRGQVPASEATYRLARFRRPALTMLFAMLGSLLVLRPMLIPTTSSGDPGVLLYEIIMLYVAPAAAFLVGFVLIASPLEQTLPQTSPFDRTVLSAAMTSAILAVLLHNLIDFAIFEPGVWMTLWIAMACLIASTSPHNEVPVTMPASPARRAALIAGVVLVVGVYYLYVWRPVWSATLGMQNGLQAASNGQFDRAHKALDAATVADPLSSAPANLNGRLYLQQYEMAKQKSPELIDKAVQCLRQAIRTNPADYKNYEKLAQTYSQSRQWQDAHDWYLQAVELYPGCERLWFRLGQTAEQLGETEAALTYYTKAVEVEESYQQQFRRMYPEREKVISRLGEEDFALARNRISQLSGQPQRK
ncbi:MAG: O-antigen ligase family protein [Sedimentisphaerales bacterium]|nr:O-antigen ligase family protein [Sedimentisphaerales bacterium]